MRTETASPILMNTISLPDAVPALQIISGCDLDTAFRKSADINDDGKIGVEEAIYVLQQVAE